MGGAPQEDSREESCPGGAAATANADSSFTSKPPRPPAAGMDRATAVATQVLRKARSKFEGDELFKRLRSPEGNALAAELGIPEEATLQDFDDAYKRCLPQWNRSAEGEVDFLVKHALQKCSSLMDVDRQMRSLQSKIGRRLHGQGVLTQEILTAAHSRCHEYWARVTPGNVSAIVSKVKSSCDNWDAASKKFTWLWTKGTWSPDGKHMSLGSRTLTAEDLDQAERQCRRSFGLPGDAEVRKARVAVAPEPSSQQVSMPTPASEPAACQPVAPAQPADPPVADAVGEPVAAPLGAVPLPAPEPSPPPKPPPPALSNADFLVEHILKKCSSEESAKKFFVWLHSEQGKRIKGRVITGADVEEAERRCKEAWAKQNASSSSSSSSGSSSDEEEAAAPAPKAPAEPVASTPVDASADVSKAKADPPEGSREKKAKVKKAAKDDGLGNVDFLVQKVMKKASSMNKAEKIFDKLHGTVGSESQFGRVFSEEEITEAWLTVSSHFENQEVAEQGEAAAEGEDADAEQGEALDEEEEEPRKKPKKQKSSKKLDKDIADKNVNNVDALMKYVLRKCQDSGKAEKLFDKLRDTVGSESFLGRTFTEEEITEAWFRCTEVFQAQEAAEEEEEDDEDSEGGSSSSYEVTEQKKRGKKAKGAKGGRKDKLKRSKSKLVDEELEGALFNSDSDSLDAEEQVDIEDESLAVEMMADLGAEEEPEQFDDGYPVKDWEEIMPHLKPGDEGFNQRATEVMKKAGVGEAKMHVSFDAQAACPPLQPHQESIGFLMHPKSPLSKLLVDHPTGSGKTREMIKTLDNYFFDSRPKVPIFPKDPVCRNFYSELLRWPSRYRDYFCCERPADAAICCSEVAAAAQLRKEGGKPNWKEYRFHMWNLSNFHEEEVRRLGYSIREVLEMKGMFYMGKVRASLRAAFHKRHPGEFMPTAPLRAINYTSAGGAFSSLTPSGKPVSCLMKIGFDRGSNNVYSNKIVLMDEAHNLVRTQTQYGEQLQHLRDLLKSAKNLVLAGFTGTPILNEPTEGRQLLDIIKGEGAPEGDHGFLSSFPFRPQPLFPVSMPRGLPDGVLTMSRRRQLCKRVEMTGETLKMYDVKRRLQLPPRRLRAYCNVSTFHATFHEGKRGSKIKVLTFPEEHCPKLLAIANEVASSPLKAIVMTGRMSGHVVMLELMRFIAAKADPPFGVATMDELAEFNHVTNLRGEIYRVLVADAAQCSEGVSFLSVRRTFLSDVPTTPSMFIQQCGRAIRMYGHRGLPTEEQTVTTMLYVSVFPRWLRTSSLACWALRAQKKHTSGKEVERRGRLLTARLNRAGIKTLEELKARIDRHGEAKKVATRGDAETLESQPGKLALTSEDVIQFLEQNGLGEEAKLLRNVDKKEKEKEKAFGEVKASLTKTISDGTSLARLESVDSLGRANSIGRAGTLDSIDLEESLAEAIELETGEGPTQDEFAAALEDVLDDEGVPQASGASGVDTVDSAAADVAAAVREPAFSKALVPTSAVASNPQDGAGAPNVVAVDIPAEEAVAKALEVVRRVCSNLKEKAPPAAPAEGDLENDVGLPGEAPWKAQLEKGLERLRHTEPVGAALRAAVHPTFEPATDDLRELVADQVKALRDELVKLEKISTLNKALAVLKDVRGMIERSASLALQAAEQARLEAALAESSRTITPRPEVVEGTSESTAALGAAGAAATPAPEALTVAPAEKLLDQPHVNGSASGELVGTVGEAAVLQDAQSAAAPAQGEGAVVSVDATAATPQAGADPGDAIVPTEVPQAAADEEGAIVPTGAPQAAASAEGAIVSTAAVAAAHANGAIVTASEALDASARPEGAIVPAEAAIDGGGELPQVPAGPSETDLKEAERAWRQRLATGLRALKGSDYIRAALKVATPSILETADETLDALTADSVKRLQEELSRLQEQAEKGGVKPRALVRAMQQLYLAESTRDASLSLATETADEEALRQLAERTEEFAPALESMRSLAVDRDIFAHLADIIDDGGEDHASEEEASDLEQEREMVARDGAAGVVLPEGWRYEYVQRGKRQMKEFIDQDGKRYRTAKEARAAIAILEAAREEAERIAAENAAVLAAAAEGGPPAKRVRLRSKVSEANLGSSFESAFGAGGLEAAFEEALGDALGDAFGDAFGEVATDMANGTTPTAAGGATASSASKPAVPPKQQLAPEAKPGAKVTLKGLVAKPELNGKVGRLLAFNMQTGRWECQLTDRTKVNVKPSNFDVVVPKAAPKSQPAKRPAPSPAEGAPPGKALANARGRGRGRAATASRGAAPNGRGGRGAAIGGGGSDSD